MSESNAPNMYDLAADSAEKELLNILDGLGDTEMTGAMAVIRWQEKNYGTAGHKRLGRILVKLATKKEQSPSE